MPSFEIFRLVKFKGNSKFNYDQICKKPSLGLSYCFGSGHWLHLA